MHLFLLLLNKSLLGLLEQLVVQRHLRKGILGGDKDARSRPLGGSSSTQVKLTGDIEVRNAAILAHDRKVDNNVNRADIASNDAESLAALSEGLHNLLNTSSNELGLRCLLHQLVQLLGGLLGSQRGSNFADILDLRV